MLTVKPLLSVVDSVVDPWLTGVASARRVMDGRTALIARCARSPVCRLSASLREAIAGRVCGWVMESGEGTVSNGCGSAMLQDVFSAVPVDADLQSRGREGAIEHS